MTTWYFPELLMIISILFLITITAYYYYYINIILVRRGHRNDDVSLLPPGPPTLPLIGNLHQLILTAGRGALPHHVISKLSVKYGPVMRLQLGECLAVVVSSPAAAKEVLGTKELSFPQRHRLFSVEIMTYGYAGLVFAPFGDYWRRVRKMCVSELLSAKRVGSFRPIREEEVWDLMAAISSSSSSSSPSSVAATMAINLRRMILAAGNNVTARAALGAKCRDGPEFQGLIKQASEILAGFNLADLYPSFKFLRHVTGVEAKLKRIHERIDRILEEVVNQHSGRINGRGGKDDDDGLLDVLMKLQDSGEVDCRLTTDQIKAVTLDMMSGGSETSAITIEWAMAELMNNPTAMAKAQSELRQALNGKPKIQESDLHRHNLTYLKSIVKETLRLHPPLSLIFRECTHPCEIGGYRIPEKATVLVNAYAIGRDPKVWTEPDRFRPERFVGSTVDFIGSDFEFIPFGGGRRMCPGITFATATIELALAQMLYHFDWSLPRGVDVGGVDMSESFGAASRKKHNLYLVPTVSIPFVP